MKRFNLLAVFFFVFVFLYCGDTDGGGDGDEGGDNYSIQVPTGVIASDGFYTDHIHVTWNPVSDANEYIVNVYDAPPSTAQAYWPYEVKSTSFDMDWAYSENVHNWFTVQAKNSRDVSEESTADEGWTSNSGIYIPSPPGLHATQGTYSDHINISWDDSVVNAVSYNVYRSTGNDLYVFLANISTTLMSNYNVAPNMHYWYKVTAVDSSNAESVMSLPCEGWSSSSYTFKLVNGTEGFLTNAYIGSYNCGDMEPDDECTYTYTSIPDSIAWSAETDYPGMGSNLTWGDSHSPSDEAIYTVDIVLDSNYFSLWIKNSSIYTWDRFYYNSTTTYYSISLIPDSSKYYWFGFYSPYSTSNYWQSTYNSTAWKWGTSFPGGGGAAYSYSTNSYGSHYVNCTGSK